MAFKRKRKIEPTGINHNFLEVLPGNEIIKNTNNAMTIKPSHSWPIETPEDPGSFTACIKPVELPSESIVSKPITFNN